MSINGCKERKCPCKMWIQCHNYININNQQQRLKNKKYNFEEWYDTNFRVEIKMSDTITNG